MVSWVESVAERLAKSPDQLTTDNLLAAYEPPSQTPESSPVLVSEPTASQ